MLLSTTRIASKGILFRRIVRPILNDTLSSETKYRPLIARDRPKPPWRKRRRFILAVVVVIILIAASGGYLAANSLESNNQVRTASSTNACYSLLLPNRNVNQLPASWSYSTCLYGYGHPYIGTSPEISYTITGPGVLFTVSGTISAKYTITVGSENYYGTFSRSYATSLNANDSEWSMNVPCDGYNGCTIDIFNNATTDNHIIVNFTAS